MSRTESLGQFEQLVLSAVLTLGERAYGRAIHAKVTEYAGGKEINLGSVYVTLDRLQDKGYVTSWFSDPTPERGGRSKRYFRLEAIGERSLQEAMGISKRMCEEVGDSWRIGKWKPGRAK